MLHTFFRFIPQYYLISFLSFFFVLVTTDVHAKVLLEDTAWEGEVLVEEDIVVPKGVTLTIKKNTVVNIVSSDSTKTDPEYMSPLSEITVRGILLIEGSPKDSVLLRVQADSEKDAFWAGIIVDGGTAVVRSATIRNAETGIWLISGEVDLQSSTLTSNRYGLVAQSQTSKVSIVNSKITGNTYGLISLGDAIVERKGSKILGNEKLEFHYRPADNLDYKLPKYIPATESKPRELKDEVLVGDTIWDGYVIVDGRVRVPVDSRLVILPGTVVEFRKKDTNGDGIGENGLMLQGVLIAKGTAEKPIIFRSAEIIGRKGDWDSINVINSDGVRNIIEYCQFEDAYRGLHFHFSNVVIQHSVFRNNYRGVQFQESTVELLNNYFYANHSGIQARDSEIIFSENQVVENIFGANFLRAHLTIQDNTFGSNVDFGLKIREGYPTVSRNVLHHNRFGLMFSDMSYGVTSGNLMLDNGETGLSVRNGSNMAIQGNFIQANGLSGISVRDTLAVIKDNHISENGERGIGLISFQGSITGNILLDNNLYAIAAENETDVQAPLNWFGQGDIEPIIFDVNDDKSRGRVHYEPVAQEAPVFSWPLVTIPVSLKWLGRISVPETVTVPATSRLSINPGAAILFSTDTGLHIHGRFIADGKKDKRITFSSLEEKEPESWGEVRLENALNSRISNSDFEYATWGVHSHFTTLKVKGCTFSNNVGGIRFRSGPLTISNSMFSDNGIGIRSYRGKAEITNNIVTRNEKGIFVREKGDGLLITGNNIFDNTDYNIWVGDFNLEDIAAPGNWWGLDDPTEKFFDARREPGIGTVLFEPALAEPLEIAIEDS